MLGEVERKRFWDEGYLVVEDAVTPAQLAALRGQLADWIEESRGHAEPYGELIDGRPRFDLAPEHSDREPQLRRVNNPSEVSDAFGDVMRNGRTPDFVAEIFGPDIVFHHDKINLKLPGAGTEVGYHQDFSYTPHSNSDQITALLLLDDMTEENGCLTVIPGSHKLGQISLWHEGVFTGTVGDEEMARHRPHEVRVTGKAGSVCLMHSLLLHGSAANRSQKPRGLYIANYCAADARPLSVSPVPSSLQGVVVRGRKPRWVRSTLSEVELPDEYRESSFFEVQRRHQERGAA